MIKLLEIFKRLFEAKCPACGKEGAYVGLNSIECPNRSCKHFDQKMKAVLPKDVDLAMRVISLWSVSETFGAYVDEDVMEKEVGMKLFHDDPFGAYYDPKFWEETRNAPSPGDEDVLHAGHYEDVYLRAIHPESKKFAKWMNEPKQIAASRDQFDVLEDLPEDLRGKINAIWTAVEVNKPSWLNYDMEKIGEYLNTLNEDDE